jgi:tetratricopeptide (TPR) repeat protein
MAKIMELGARAGLKKALAQQRWDEAIRCGVKVLAVNPWDSEVLMGMAQAANKSGDRDCEIIYTMSAVKGSPKDPICNRLHAIALAERGLLDDAMVFWRRVEEVRPTDEEAKRNMATLLVQKQRSSGKFDEDDATARKTKFKQQKEEEASLEKTLQEKIEEEPRNVKHYLELAQFYLNEERYDKADEVFAKAFEVSDGDQEILEKWEDTELRRRRQQITRTEDEDTRKGLERQYLKKEVEVYQNRVKRYPSDLRLRYELGQRYFRSRRYDDAIKELQIAKNDPRRRGLCLLALAKCFQQIKQLSLAMNHYEGAIQEIPDRDAENRKEALRLAGTLALHLRNLDAATQHLSALAAMDYTYKNVSELLDKLARLRENKGPEQAASS